ncbi:transcriptional regulator [Clostridia bacterium]|nr:transcriptional regulator [Clostridia bacterium]
MQKVRLQDIADDARVSVATVTRVIRGSASVSRDKQTQVESSILKLGYVVPLPQSRQTSCPPKLLGHIIHQTHQNMIFARLVDSINHFAAESGYTVITDTVKDEHTAAEILDRINKLRELGACGIILTAIGGNDFRPLQSCFTNMAEPIVMVERIANVMGINKVILNNSEGMYVAVQHLHSHGHRRIAYLAPDWDADVERQRRAGYQSAMRAFSLDHEIFIPCELYSVEGGCRAFASWLKKNLMPTALIANDTLLSGVQQYLYEHNLRVPDDISLVGMDDTWARLSSPPLTSLAFPEDEMARTAVGMIVETLDTLHEKSTDARKLPRTVALSTALIERQSVSAPRIDNFEHNGQVEACLARGA